MATSKCHGGSPIGCDGRRQSQLPPAFLWIDGFPLLTPGIPTTPPQSDGRELWQIKTAEDNTRWCRPTENHIAKNEWPAASINPNSRSAHRANYIAVIAARIKIGTTGARGES